MAGPSCHLNLCLQEKAQRLSRWRSHLGQDRQPLSWTIDARDRRRLCLPREPAIRTAATPRHRAWRRTLTAESSLAQPHRDSSGDYTPKARSAASIRGSLCGSRERDRQIVTSDGAIQIAREDVV